MFHLFDLYLIDSYFHILKNIRQLFKIILYGNRNTTLAKVSDKNLFWADQNHSDSFWYLYSNQCESFRTNSKNFLYLVWWKTVKNRSDLVRSNPRQKSEWLGLILIEIRFGSIRARIVSEWKLGFGFVRIHLDCCLGVNRIRSDWFLTVFHQTSYKTFFRNDSHWLGYRYLNKSE